jgi:hypothetical protein
MPITKKIFQISFFQSYLKKEMFLGIQMAQKCRKEEETPSFLFPISNNKGIINPINIPATAQCQGCLISSNIN